MRALFNIQRLEGPCVQRVLLNLLAMTVLQATTRTAGARTWTVDKYAPSDFAVIQDAVDAAAPGDTILVFPGRYVELEPYDFGALTESTVVVLDKPGLTLRGTDRESVIIGPVQSRWETSFEPNGIATTTQASEIRIENLTVEQIPQGIVLERRTMVRDVNVRNCVIGMPIWSDEQVVVERVELAHCTSEGLVCWGDAEDGLLSDVTAIGYHSGLLFSGSQNFLVERPMLLDSAYIQFQARASGTIRHAEFQGGGLVVLTSDTRVEHSRFAHSASFAIEASESVLSVTDSVLEGGAFGTLLLRSETEVAMHDCHLLHTSLPAVDVRFYDGLPGPPIDLSSNWWGTTDPAQVAEWIVDANDSPDRGGTVTYEPIATQPLRTPKKSIGRLKALYGDPRTP